jgi:cytochrome c peroxidase
MTRRVLLPAILAFASLVLMHGGSSAQVAPPELLFPLPKPIEPAAHPLGNPGTPARIALGRRLFFDSLLSRDGRVSCATCHEPDKAFSDGRRVATGIEGRAGTRNVPSLVNVGHGGPLFWDGRAATLEEQALAPIENPQEMGMPLDGLVAKLNASGTYRESFRAAFDGAATAERVGQALAAFQRTLVSTDTPLDRYLRGDSAALPPRAFRGMRLFYGQARCAACHSGPNLSDGQFHNIGTADPGLADDPGRRAVTGKTADQGAFRTPQLREIGRTAPYMHSGRFSTLEQVVVHYNFGGVTDAANEYRDEKLQVLYLSEEEVGDLVAFLKEGLTSPPAASRPSR